MKTATRKFQSEAFVLRRRPAKSQRPSVLVNRRSNIQTRGDTRESLKSAPAT